MFKTLFLQIEETTVYSAQRYLLSTCVDTQVDWPNSFWDMTKCSKPNFCKLKKQQCIQRIATCWAQRVDTQVDWPNSFWDMRKCSKPYFCKLKKQQCIRRSATCWAHALTLRSIGPIVYEIWQNVQNLIFANWRNNSVFDAALPAEHTRWHSGRLAQ